MAYKIRYDGDADVLTVILERKGKLSHAKKRAISLFILTKMGSPFLWRYSRPARLFH